MEIYTNILRDPLKLPPKHTLQPGTLPLKRLDLRLTHPNLPQQRLHPRLDLIRLPGQLTQQLQLLLALLDRRRLDLDQLAQDAQVESRSQDRVVDEALEGGLVDGFARFDGVRAAGGGGEDGDELGLFERVQDGVARGFEGVGEEELVVAEGGVGGEGFDEEPGLGGGPGVGGWGEVEDVHF